jgi:hypothetical protein
MANTDANECKIKFSVTKKDGKKDAPEYQIKTVEDIFRMVTLENHERFLHDFKTMVGIIVEAKELAKKLGENENETLKVSEYTWIDD